MKYLKKFLVYLCIFFATATFLFFALVLTSKIPRSAIEDNLKESLDFYRKNDGVQPLNRHVCSYIHYYADVRKLNIIYCMDSDDPVKATLWSKYYQIIRADSNKDFIKLVENSYTPNTQYLRYWNGVMLFLRPLLTVFNMEQIYLINKILLSILVLILLVMLFKRSKKIAFIFLLALVLFSVWYVSFCIEYSVAFYIMFITTILVLKIDNSKKENYDVKKANSKLLKLFLITGISTCFFDFLTTEILTLFVPLLIILLLRKEENRLDSLKDIVKFSLKACILWFLGYCGMWIAKWVLASLILNINAFKYVDNHVALRINGLQGLSNINVLYRNVIKRNFFTIPIVEYIYPLLKNVGIRIILITIVFLVLAIIDWKNLKKKKFLLIILFIALMPYARYLVLANHSFRHVMFTFRDQMITVMCLSYIIIDCLNYKLLNKQVISSNHLKNKNKKKSKEKDKDKNKGKKEIIDNTNTSNDSILISKKEEKE